MGRIFHPLLFLLARCTKNELIRQIEFLRAENEILRTRVRRKFVRLNPDERNRLVSWEAIGPGVRVKIGMETGWRYTGVMGEMRKLGITDGLRFTARWGPPEFAAAWLIG